MYSSSLKPFVLNASDLAFILKQINFRPLFDAAGNAIVNWTGVGAIYDGHGNQIWDGTTGGLTAQQALDAYGPSYASTTSSQGLRDVSGLNNNLHLLNAGYGASDQDFLRTVAAEYDLDAHGHVYYSGSPAYVSGTDQFDAPIYGTAYWANKVYANAFGGVAGFTLPVGTSVDYAITDANNDQVIQTTELNNIVDYTPRMISRLITTGGVTFQLDVNGHIDYSNGVASVTDWGLLQTLGIQDAQARFDGTPGTIEVAPGVFENEYFVGAQNPGVSPTNGWFTIFGQFFDHGLDFIDKGGQGKSIKITFAADDPLYGELGSDGRPATYISVARATVDGFDAEGNPTYINHTAPLIDQSQSYGSHAAVTELLREWVIDPVDGVWKPGMNLLNGITLATPWQKSDGTMTTETLPSLNELRAHMLESGRADLTWDDIFNFNGSDQALILDMNPHFDGAHMLKGDVNQDAAVNAAIAFLGDPLNGAIRGESAPGAGDGDSFALVSGTLTLVLGTDLAAGPSTIPAGTYTGANAMMIWVNFANFGVMSTSAIGNTTVGAVGDAVGTLLLSSVGDHYIAGDGRVNENFGLTTVHHVFHEEHNFQIENIKETIHREADARNGGMVDGLFDAEYMKGFQNWDAAGVGWNAATGNWETDDGLGGGQVAWNLDTMFNAAKLVVEMEYQHVAIDQYARTVTPDIKEFVGYTAGEDPTISLEYAQAIFRFGHSQLRETIDTIDPDHGLTGKITGYALKLAFLNPEEYANLGPAAIALGMTHQQGNEIDELITPALNQGLLGLPLDLAAINIARGRDVGLPGLNEFRQAVGLRAYDGWADFGANMVHPDNLVNFIAAYTFDGDAAKAQAVIDLYDGNYANDAAAVALATSLGLTQGTMTNPEFAAYAADYALTFMNGGDKGVNNIDTWIGGLAEVHVTGGLLGETFNLVFVDQMERIQDGDRFYYLYRLVNQQFADEIAGGQFKDIIERNTGLTHLGGSAFSYSDQYYDFGATVDAANTVNNNHKYGAQLEAPGNTKGIFTDGGSTQVRDGLSVTVRITDPVTGQIVSRQFIRDTRVTDPNAPNSGTGIDGTDNSGAESTEVIVGTRFDDLIYARGGDDTVYGEAGNDIIYGGNGIDRLYGGDGKDYIYGGDGAELTDGGAGDDFIYGDSSATAAAGTDQLIGGMGNDYISGGIGIDKLAGGGGDDVIMGEGETDPFTHGGDGNDYIDGGISGDNLYGDNGDDLIIGGADQDILYGGNGDDILRPGNPSQALGGGPDEVLGGDGVYDNGFDLIDFSDNNPSTTGIVFDLTNQNNPQVQIDGTTAIPAATQMEGIIGSVSNDTLTGQSTAGTATGTWLIGGSGNDTLKGGLGNDIIIGGSLRLDDMIGHYDSGYTHNNNNDSGNAVGLTDIDANGVAHTFTQEEMNRLYQGASHRVAWDDELDVFSGLIDTINDQTWGDGTLAEKHFTEMLRTEKFKDLSLGDVAGQTNGGTDTVVFTGNSADYVFEALVFVDHAGNTHYGAAVTDSVVGRDGSDSVLDVANYTFANGTFTLAQLLAPPTASVGNATVTEGNAGTVNASFIVSLAYPAANDVTVTYTTVDGTAGAPGDYTSTPGSVTILAGQVSATVTVPVLGDTTFEANETFSINLTGADNGVTIASGTGTGTIINDDTAPTLSLSGGTVSEGDSGTSTITFTVTQSAVSGTATTVNWGTTDGTASSASDFAGGTGSVTIAAGDTSATFTVTVNGDTAIEGDEAFTVSLSAPVNATIATGTATGTIVNDDLNIVYSAARQTGTVFPGGASPAVAMVSSNPGTNAMAVTGWTNPGGDTATYSLAGSTLNRSAALADNSTYTVDLSATTTTGGVETKTVTIKTGSDTAQTGLSALAAAAGSDTVLYGKGGADQLSGNTGNDWIDGGAGVDMVTAAGSRYNYSWDLTSGLLAGTDNFPVLTDLVGNQGSDTLLAVEGLIFADGTYGFNNAGNVNQNIVLGHANVNNLNGRGGNDIVVAGNGTDTITYDVDNALVVANGGRDMVFGGGGTDTFVLNGNGSAEDFYIYSRDAFLAANPGALIGAATGIVITRNGSATADIIAELNSIEEIKVNTAASPNVGTLANGNNYTGPVSGDQIHVVGDFTGTGLAYNTITVDGGTGNDSVDITGLTSAHRVVFNTNGGLDNVVGDLRPQDIINGALGLSGTTLAAPAATEATYGLPELQVINEPISGLLGGTISEYLGSMRWNGDWASEALIQPVQLSDPSLAFGLGSSIGGMTQSFESLPVIGQIYADDSMLSDSIGHRRAWSLDADEGLGARDRFQDFGHHFLV